MPIDYPEQARLVLKNEMPIVENNIGIRAHVSGLVTYPSRQVPASTSATELWVLEKALPKTAK